MATAESISALRNLIAEPDNEEPWTYEYLSALLDASDGDLNLAASQAWTQKATQAASLVDVTESGSSRKLSDIHKNALAMSRYFKSQHEETTVDLSRRPRTRPITRPAP